MAGPPTLLSRAALRTSLRKVRDAAVFNGVSGIKCPAPLSDLLAKAKVVASYVPISSEVDPRPIVEGMTSLALPFLAVRGDVMTFRAFNAGDALEPAAFSFLQPRPTSEIVVPDLILTPLLGFDRVGNRLGQGAGHYDRYFATYPNALRIGLAWSVQEVDAIPTQPWDMPLDAICTESEWILAEQSRLNR